MALPKQVVVKETLTELKALLKKASPLISPRLRVLIEMKRNENAGIAKRALASLVGVCYQQVNMYDFRQIRMQENGK